MPQDVDVGVYVAHSPQADPAPLQTFLERVAEAARPHLEDATGRTWRFHLIESTRLSDDEPRRPSDFLDEATLHMVEGPYDLLVVLTDVALVSRRHRVMPGLASSVARVAVMSTRRLLVTPRREPSRRLADTSVLANGATLLLHLVGHMMGVRHARDAEDAMAPFVFDPALTQARGFSDATRARLRREGDKPVEPEIRTESWMHVLAFYARSLATHPRGFWEPLLRNRAPLLPLTLPSLVTAAVIPIFILVFTAEIWDVGLAMSDRVAYGGAVVSIVAATFYFTFVQNLLFPRKEKRVLMTHLAVANAVIFTSMLLAVIGLFLMVGGLILVIEFFVFPEGLMLTWPTLEIEGNAITVMDRVRLAVFVSTLGVLTGALGGGLESRTVIRHLALFPDET